MDRSASRYEVLTHIATGGMATVYVGRLRGAVGFSRLVAIKKPHPFVTTDEALKKQLEHEARIAAMIHHPNVVSVLDVEEIDGEVALVMDYVEGCTLRDLLDRAETEGRPIDRIAVRILLDVAAGLHAAHLTKDASGQSLGLVHRDVSPHNVLIGRDGVARLTDFGIAKVTDAERERTATDVLKGKLAYLAPEYVEERRFDARSDLFALGVIAWESFALARLFKGATTVETLKRVIAADAPPLGTVRPELAPFEGVVASALHRAPEERPVSVDAFATELEARARAAAGVASHAEVGAMVESVWGARATERRRAIESSKPRPLSELKSARDDVATVSFVAPPAPESARTLPSERASSARRRRVALLVGLAIVVVGGFAALKMRAPKPADAVPSSSSSVAELAPSAPQSASPSAPPSPPTSSTPSAVASAPPPAPAAHHPPASHAPPRPTHTASLVPTHAPPNPYAH